MKVKKTTKKVPSTHPEIEKVVQRIVACSQEELPNLLREIFPPSAATTSASEAAQSNVAITGSVWKWPRGDLHPWIPVLDKFDDILERLLKEYNLVDSRVSADNKTPHNASTPQNSVSLAVAASPTAARTSTLFPPSKLAAETCQADPTAGIQVKDFSPLDKDVIQEILRLQKLFLENGTSRKLFSSYDRLASLLFTSDLQVLCATLEVLLKPSQQYSVHTQFELSRGEGGKYPEVHKRLLGLASGWGTWGSLKEKGRDMVALASSDPNEVATASSAFAQATSQDLQISFYRTADSAPTPQVQASVLEQPTADLQLKESTGFAAESTPIDSPSKPSTSRSSALQYSFGLGDGTPSAARATSTGESSTPRPARPVRMESDVGAESETTSGIRASTNSDGYTTITLSSQYIRSAVERGLNANQVLATLVKQYHPPKNVWYTFLGKLRSVMILSGTDAALQELRRDMIVSRMLALATYAFLTPEDVAQSELFLYEPTLITQLASLAHPNAYEKVGDRVIGAAFVALEAILRYRSKATEVLSAVNANVGHGILMSCFRSLVARLSSDQDAPHDLMDSILAFLGFAATIPGANNMLVGAGIIPLLIDLVKVDGPGKASYVARGIGLIDTFLYANANAFGLFCNAGGLEILIGRISSEVKHAVEYEGESSDTDIFRRTTVLKLLLRSIQRMMQASGTAEGLRNVIDSSLTKSLDQIFRNFAKVGSPVLALAINLTATFVHNEPTSLAVIQEMKLHESLYDAMEFNAKPSFDVISAIPNAISAMCLNAAGVAYTEQRKSVITGLVLSITTEAYRESGLTERDNAMFIGTSLDELARHQPVLRPVLMQSLIQLLKNIAEAGKTGYSKGIKTPRDYRLVAPGSDDSASAPSASAESSQQQESTNSDQVMKDVTATHSEEKFDQVVEVAAKFLQGVFHNTNLSREFLELDGLQLVLDLYSAPALVSQFATTNTAPSLNHVVRSLAEADVGGVLRKIISVVESRMSECRAIWESKGTFSRTLVDMYKNEDIQRLDEYNAQYRQLITLNNLIGLMSELFVTVGFAHGKVATSFLESLGVTSGSTVLLDLGKLHRSSILANITLKLENHVEGFKIKSRDRSHLSLAEQVSSPIVEVPRPSQSRDLNALGLGSTATDGAASISWPQWKTDNFASVRYVATQFSIFLTPFFQSVGKMLLFRRMEPSHKAAAQPTARQMASVLLEHLEVGVSENALVEKIYRTTMLGLVSLYLLDARNTPGTLQTLLLVHLHRKGGLSKIAALAASLMDECDRLAEKPLDTSDQPESRQKAAEAAQAFHSLKVVMDLIKTLVSSRTVMESTQTTLLITAGRDKQRGDPDYFNHIELLASTRLAFFEVVRRAWDSKWLSQASGPNLHQARSIVQAMFGLLEDLPKQTETPSRSVADALLGVLGGGIPVAPPAPFVLNESYVDTLAEMGFTRYAATHALTRLRNNLPAATEYLLSHAHLIEEPPAVPAEPAPVAAADAAPDAPLPETEQAGNPAAQHQAENADVEMVAAVTPSGPSYVDEEPVVEEDPEEVKKRLAELCAEVKPSVPARSLALVDSHDGLVFDVGSVFLQVESGLQTILNSVRTANPAEQGPDGEQCLASRLRLLAVILNANDASSKFTEDLRSEFMDTISSLPHADAEHRYKWIAAQFLCAQALFRLADGIRKVDVGSPMPDSIFTGPSFDTARKSFFASSLALLRSGECSPEELSAALRLLVSLTRDRALACQLLENGQVQLLFDIIQRTPRKEAGNCLGFVNMIIRHIVEDDETLQASIQREIRAWFNKPRSKVVDVAHFVSNIRPVALRDPEIFLRAVEQECALVTPEPPRSGPFHIQSKDAVRSAPAVRKGADHPMEQAQPADDPFKIVPLPVAVKTNRDQLIQHLTTELQSILSKAQSETSEAKLDEAASREDMRAVAEDTALYHRVCALLLSLTELLGSYTACKSAFITQGGAKLSGKDTGLQSGRGRVSMVSYLLNNFICNLSFDTDVARSDGQALTSSQRRWLNISNWASSAIVALCADTGSGGTLKDIPSELVAVRKSVLDTIIKAIKDVGSSSENINLRYGRLWALSELSYRLLTAKASVQTRHRDETAIHLAKIMLEKGFVTTLTNTLTEVDLNFPNVKVLISAILQPLEYLTKMSTKMGRAEKSKDLGTGEALADEMSTDSETEDEGDEDEEMAGPDDEDDAPDLYRNSALGMFGGEMDDYMEEEGDEDEDVDEDGEPFDEEDEMDEGSDGTEPSSDSEMEEWDDVDDDDSVDDEGAEDGPAEFVIEHNADEIGDDDEDDMDGDMDDMDDMDGDMEGDMMEIEEDGIDFDEEDDGEDMDPDMDDEEGSGIFEEIYEEMEPLDDGGDVGVSPGTSGPMNSWGWSQPPQSAAVDLSGSRIRRRQHHQALLDEEAASFAMFGRSRSAATPPTVNMSDHPLLQRDPEPEPATRNYAPRRALRAPGAQLQDIMQSLNHMIGGEALTLIDRLMAGGGESGAIRIDVNPSGHGGTIDLHVDARALPGQAGGGAAVGGQLSESVPQPTINRWSEEEKLVVGNASTSRVSNLVNLVINTLLPEARRRMETDRKKQEDERIEIEKKAKAAAEDKARKEAEEQAKRNAEEEERKRQAEAAAAAEADSAPSVAEAMDVDSGAGASAEVQPVEGAGAVDAAQPAVTTPPRVTILIHGAEVDITETGIDPEFLEALPDDMRADVVNQHLRARQPEESRGAEPASSSEISAEFLDALPPEIRAEVIEQEALERARRAAEATRASAARAAVNDDAIGVAVPPGVDPGTFLSSLEPGLRQVVLMDQSAGGPEVVQRSARPAGHQVQASASAGTEQNPDVKKSATRDAIQLLDKAGIASLVRLLFFPDLSRRSYLIKVLGNLCENARSRADLFSLLLGILVDGTGDVQLVQDVKQPKGKLLATATPKTTPRRRNVPETPAAPISNMFGHLQSGNIPAFVAQRCFEGLAHIIGSNEQASIYFLTESDGLGASGAPATIRKSTSKKGKAKEREQAANYPIVALLGLLDRHALLAVPNMMESLTSLLATITKPLLQLKNKTTDAEPTEGRRDVGSGLSTTGVAPSAPTAEVTVNTSTVAAAPAVNTAASSSETVLTRPPVIPPAVLRLVAKILTTGECTSRTFSYTLVLIKHLSAIPEARDVISAELKYQAQYLADELAVDLRELSGDLPSLGEKPEASGISLTKFAPASSSQAKLLRILKTIDYMFTSTNSAEGGNSGGLDLVAMASSAGTGPVKLTEDEQRASEIYDSLQLTPCWDALGECLDMVNANENLTNVATVLLPLVESLMVVCKYASAHSAAARHIRASSSPLSPMSPKEVATEDHFVRFTNAHRKILNVMVRNNPSLLSGSFSLLVLNPRILEFDNKRSWFSQQLRNRTAREAAGVIHLSVRRKYVFEDSYTGLQRKSGDALKYGKLSVKFHGEEGVDAGGVTREWYSVLAQSIFNPGYCLFEPCAADQQTYQPSQRSWVNGDHLSYFRFIGKMIGKAIYDGRLLDAYFSRAFYKQILGRKVDLRDLESVDPEYHKSLVWMLENDIEGIIDLDFSMEVEEFGTKKVIDLKPNGASIPVTNENKEEYVRLVVQYRLDTSIKEQVAAFLQGFYEIIPSKLISIFDPDQLELLISGISTIDVDELKNSTQLHGWKDTDPEITWFWRALRSFSQEERARFLMFATSSSRVPLQGFAHLQGSSGVQPFQIHKLHREDVLPSSATCFNELLLPSYPNYEALRSRLLTAITEGSQGFGLA